MTTPLSVYVSVYVPVTGYALDIKRGSGIVGSEAGDRHGYRMVEIDFEGNLYGAENIRTYADRVWVAAARHVAHAPTVARLTVPTDALVYVGDFHDGRIDFDPVNFLALADWLDVEDSPFDPRELLTSNFRPQNAP